ncbi:MAG TPA: cyclic nucleotide-binding domain-containing protein, partial [Gemmatimonadales bacterium]|nr:cyclic nucleotide-binding domain-containing protein [Gemmatimonadales bacterium]
MANPDDVIPDVPALPPGSEFSYLEGRLHEIFGPLSEADIPRLARFGERCSFPDGAMLFEVGKPSRGMFVMLSGRVAFNRRDALGRSIPIWDREGRGHFLAEVGQISGADSLVDVQARGPVEALLLSPEKLRALLVAEVELGGRILRSLTLRRIGLLALGFGGPILMVGRRTLGCGRSRNSFSALATRTRSSTRKPTPMPRAWSSATPRGRTI